MKNGTIKSIQWMCWAIIVVSLLCLTFMTFQSYHVLTGTEVQIDWNYKPAYKYFLFWGRLVFGIATTGLLIAFIRNTLYGLTEGVIFPRVNVVILYWLAGMYCIYEFCGENVGNLYKGTADCFTIQLDAPVLIFPIAILVFAQLYRIAVTISEENNLTI